MITVGLIDDGIEFNEKLNIERCIEITPDLKIKKDKALESLHGKVCADIIRKYYSEVKFISIKILGRCMNGSKDQLIEAINWCIINKVKVINISLGTVNYRDFKEIRKVINRAYDEGIIIIAACSNRNIFTYPASCTNVIGVKSDGELKEGEYSYNLYPLDGIEITACGAHKLLFEDIKTTTCNSYAAPMITAKVCSIIDEFPDITLEKLKIELYKNSINYKKDILRVNNYKNIDWINNNTLIYARQEDTNILKDAEEINKNNIFSKKKDSIIIDDKYESFNYKLIYPDENIKFWHPSIIEDFYKESLKKKLDIPLVAIYGSDNKRMIQVLNSLTLNFKREGYYAICSYTKSIGILYGMEYILKREDESVKNLKEKIEALYKVYDCDIIILGICMKKEDFHNINEINKGLKPDKIVLFLEDYSIEKDENIEKALKEKSFFITLEKIVKNNCIDNIVSYKDLNLLYKKLVAELI